MPLKKPTFLKQKNMLRVLYSLIPVALVAVYYFGWRVIALTAVVGLAGFATEWIMASSRKGKVSYAVFVTAALLGLSLPPTLPYWMAAVGGVIAVLFGKETFGGFGKNVFNPAIVGRGFLYVCFPIEMTSWFVPSFTGFPGGFARWGWLAQGNLPQRLAGPGLVLRDAVTAATPMWARRDYGYVTDLLNLLFGNIGGTFQYEGETFVLAAGSAGEVSAIAIALAAMYLIVTKTAQWRLMLSTVLGAAGLTIVLRLLFGIDAVPPLPFTLLSGALLYGAVFMVTDPVSAPKQKTSQWIYGALIGIMVVFFRYRSIFAGGLAFSILIGNMFAPSLDLWLKRIQSKRTSTA
ncbi:MAG: RnfABCDGE type electron transport complex subunit D [Chitinivibrionales bacterium]|nr:RnfABCDGE type electron transport complex subunit D [Chitinivibrionales bacterium]